MRRRARPGSCAPGRGRSTATWPPASRRSSRGRAGRVGRQPAGGSAFLAGWRRLAGGWWGLWFALLVAAWTVLAVHGGPDTGLLYLAPALLLCAPLIVGRYIGEEQLAEL